MTTPQEKEKLKREAEKAYDDAKASAWKAYQKRLAEIEAMK